VLTEYEQITEKQEEADTFPQKGEMSQDRAAGDRLEGQTPLREDETD
jgi:hypothetical protein